MTRTEDRLTDALGAAASALREDTLCPLTAPQRRRRRSAWAAPAAAAVSLLLVVGLGVAVAGRLPGTVRAPGSSAGPAAPHRYYVETGLFGNVVVRSAATGAVTATVLDPEPNNSGQAVVASSGNGTFFVAGDRHQTGRERIFRFRLTDSGKVTGFAPVPGGLLGAGQLADALAVSPDGSRLAAGISFFMVHPKNGKVYPPGPPDQIFVINTATGARSVWRGGMHALGSGFGVASLSWTGDGHELVVLGQWCEYQGSSNETCDTRPAHRHAEVWALDPASGGGRLASGRLLLRESARYPYIAQALISPDGSTITAVVLSGPVTGSSQVMGMVPGDLSVRQISVATGRQLGTLYRRSLGDTAGTNADADFLALSQDAAGQHWMLNGGIASHGYNGFNGWIDSGRLVPLSPRDGREAGEAW
jgi:hypothetical protein